MSPLVPTPDDHVQSEKHFASRAMDLLDHEVETAIKIVTRVQERWQYKASTPANLEGLRDEVLTRLMEVGIIATFDPTPCLHGDPPDLEIIGSARIHKTDGFDHEKKGYEVNAANERGEDYLGQKGKSG